VFDGLVEKASPRPAIRWSARARSSRPGTAGVVADVRSRNPRRRLAVLLPGSQQPGEAVAIAKNCPGLAYAPWWKCVKSRRNVLAHEESSDGRTARDAAA